MARAKAHEVRLSAAEAERLAAAAGPPVFVRRARERPGREELPFPIFQALRAAVRGRKAARSDPGGFADGAPVRGG